MSNETLLAQVKRKLNITWEDDDTTARVEEIMESAIPDLKHKLGIVEDDFDFSQPGTERNLFLSYCLYEWNHSLPEFDDNYSNIIAQCRAKHEVRNHVNSGVITDA
jgi:hypothetical protein